MRDSCQFLQKRCGWCDGDKRDGYMWSYVRIEPSCLAIYLARAVLHCHSVATLAANDRVVLLCVSSVCLGLPRPTASGAVNGIRLALNAVQPDCIQVIVRKRLDIRGIPLSGKNAAVSSGAALTSQRRCVSCAARSTAHDIHGYIFSSLYQERCS